MQSSMPPITDDVLHWLKDEALHGIPFSVYWNNEEMEKAKVEAIRTNNHPGGEAETYFDTVWAYLRDSTTYVDQYESVLRLSGELGLPIRGTGVDVAAGVCWTTALLSRLQPVTKLYAVDFSKYRLLGMAPQVFDALGAEKHKISRALGSFYDIKLADETVDFCFLAQAFHHADRPRDLLAELRRILKPGGILLVIGEEPVYPGELAAKRMKNLMKLALPRSCYTSQPVRKFMPTFEELFPADEEAGDHYYHIRGYWKIFSDCGFGLHPAKRKQYTVFVATKSVTVPAHPTQRRTDTWLSR